VGRYNLAKYIAASLRLRPADHSLPGPAGGASPWQQDWTMAWALRLTELVAEEGGTQAARLVAAGAPLGRPARCRRLPGVRRLRQHPLLRALLRRPESPAEPPTDPAHLG